MKNFKNIAALLLLSISSTITFTSCQDDTIEEKQVINAQAMSLLNYSNRPAVSGQHQL